MVFYLFSQLSVGAQAAFISTAFISFVPNIIFLLAPTYETGEGTTSTIISLGQSLAAGSLLGDVFLHTFHDISDMSTNENSGQIILLGYILFLIADILVRSVSNYATSTAKKDTTTSKTIPTTTTVNTSTIVLNLVADSLHNFTDGLAIGASYAAVASATAKSSSLLVSSSSVESSSGGCCSGGNNATTESLLHILLSKNGLIPTIAILLHELPHEIGDFCTLVKAGYSKMDAIKAQFTTSIAAFAGTATALYLVSSTTTSSNNNNNTAMNEYLILITAGGFIYLAATTLIPEVLNSGTSSGHNHTHNHSSSDSSSHGGSNYVSFRFRLAQLAAFFTGIAFLYIVSMLEGHDHHGHGHGHGHHSDHKHENEHEHHDHIHSHEEHHHHHHDHDHDQHHSHNHDEF